MESWMNEILQKQLKKAKFLKKLDNLFIGDSFFEFWNNPNYTSNLFYDVFPNENNLILGVKGTTALDWNQLIDLFQIQYQPKNTIINLGYNDIHTCRDDFYNVYMNFEALILAIKKKFPSTNIYLITPLNGAPVYKGYEAIEREWNILIHDLDAKIIDFNEELKGEKDYMYMDNWHINTHGYELLQKAIEKSI